jgi:hypothetical protein
VRGKNNTTGVGLIEVYRVRRCSRRRRCPRNRDVLPLRRRQLQFSEQTAEFELSRGHLNLSVFVARP